MSAHILESFLPWTAEVMKSHKGLRSVWDVIFPSEVTELCPAPTYSVPLGWRSLSVRWPLVAIFCMIGIVGGIYMGARLLLSKRRRSQQVSGYFMWGFSFVWYGFMCLGALFTHCIQTKHIRSFYLMDVIATGCSGIAAAGGFLCVWKVIDDRRWLWQIAAVSIFSAFNILALTGTPLIRDQIYVIPSALTVLLLVHHRKTYGKIALSQDVLSPDDSNAKSAEKWFDLGVIGAYLALGSVLADRWLCHTLGSHGSFLVWVFMGCDMALVSAYKYITVLRSVPAGTCSLKPKSM